MIVSKKRCKGTKKFRDESLEMRDFLLSGCIFVDKDKKSPVLFCPFDKKSYLCSAFPDRKQSRTYNLLHQQ